MKTLAKLLLLSLLAAGLDAPARAQTSSPEVAAQPPQVKLSLDVLSDTNGGTLSPYLKHLTAELRQHYVPPAAAPNASASNGPQGNQSDATPVETVIRLTLAPDGRLVAMRLEDKAHAPDAEKAAWSAVRDAAYGPTPAAMNGANLELRIHFVLG